MIAMPPYMPQKVHERAVRAFHAKRWWGHRWFWDQTSSDYCSHCSLKMLPATEAIMEEPWFGDRPTDKDFEALRDWLLWEYEEKVQQELRAEKVLENHIGKDPEDIREEFLRLLKEHAP